MHLRWPRVYRCGYRCQECVELIPRIGYVPPPHHHHLPSALNPLLCPAYCAESSCLCKQLPWLFFSALCPAAPDLQPVPVCFWLIASPSLSLCLPPAAYTLIILLVSSHPGGDFNFCRTSPFPVLVFYNLYSSSFSPLQQRSWPCPWKSSAVTWRHAELLAFSAEHPVTRFFTRCYLMYQVTQPIIHSNINNSNATK